MAESRATRRREPLHNVYVSSHGRRQECKGNLLVSYSPVPFNPMTLLTECELVNLEWIRPWQLPCLSVLTWLSFCSHMDPILLFSYYLCLSLVGTHVCRCTCTWRPEANLDSFFETGFLTEYRAYQVGKANGHPSVSASSVLGIKHAPLCPEFPRGLGRVCWLRHLPSPKLFSSYISQYIHILRKLRLRIQHMNRG